jgi:hypothetical protein
MNERIRELAEQAGFPEWSQKTIGFELEKFAELIVRECAEVAADRDALDIYEEIREHFGVEL